MRMERLEKLARMWRCLTISVLLLCIGCAGIGPKTVARDRFDYVSAISESWKRQTLLNVVKMRYADAPMFMDVTSVINQYAIEGQINLSATWAESPLANSQTLGGTGRYTDRPTITYTPVVGEKFTRSYMKPLPVTGILFMLQSGYAANYVLRICVHTINGIQNHSGGVAFGKMADPRFLELRLAAQSAQIGFAVKELYPHFTLGGSIATSSTSIGDNNILDIFDADRIGINLFGAFQWNLFNYGRLKSNVRFQDAAFQQLLVDYRNSVLEAQGEIEDAIVAYLKTHEQLRSHQRAAESSQRALDVSTEQYQGGLVNFNTVITTLTSHLQRQDLAVSTQGSVATNLVQVYKALGGGWEIRGDQDPVQLLPAAMKDEMRERTKAWKGVLQ